MTVGGRDRRRKGFAMGDDLERKLRRVRLRCGANLLLQQAAGVLAAAGLLVAAALAAERTFPVSLLTGWTLGGCAALAAGLAAALCLLRLPSLMQVGVLIDRRLETRERFSTAVAMSGSDDAFARAAADEARAAAEHLDVTARFPIRPTRRWAVTAAAWSAAGIVGLLVPHDALGLLAQRASQRAQAQQLQQANEQVRQEAQKVVSAVRQLKSEPLAAEAAKLAEALDGARPADVRRQAIRKLDELAEKLRDMQKASRFQAGGALQEMMRQLRASQNPLSRELEQALQRGDFARAAEMLRKLAQQAGEGSLSAEDRKRLAEQLEDLARQCGDLADAKKRVEEALKREGLDGEAARKLAGLSDKELREELKNRGLGDEQIDRLMEKLDALREACDNCSRLAEAMGKCRKGGRLDAEELVRLVEKLGDMGELDGEMARLAEALRQIDRAAAALGEGQGGGLIPVAGEGGNIDKVTQGLGRGRGRAWGDRPTGGPEPVGTKDAGVKNKPTKGKIIASWYYKGGQTTGDSKRALKEVVRAAGEAAADAVRDNRIPRAYEQSVRKYFGEMEKARPVEANQP